MHQQRGDDQKKPRVTGLSQAKTGRRRSGEIGMAQAKKPVAPHPGVALRVQTAPRWCCCAGCKRAAFPPQIKSSWAFRSSKMSIPIPQSSPVFPSWLPKSDLKVRVCIGSKDGDPRWEPLKKHPTITTYPGMKKTTEPWCRIKPGFQSDNISRSQVWARSLNILEPWNMSSPFQHVSAGGTVGDRWIRSGRRSATRAFRRPSHSGRRRTSSNRRGAQRNERPLIRASQWKDTKGVPVLVPFHLTAKGAGFLGSQTNHSNCQIVLNSSVPSP